MKNKVKNLNLLLADALKLSKKASQNGVLRSSKISRDVRERLINAKFLTPVIRGWYLLTSPAGAGTTTLWFGSYWEFVQQYLADRFGNEGYCLSAESSLDIYASQNIISQQLIVITKAVSNHTIQLSHGTSMVLYHDKKNFPKNLHKHNNLNLIPLAEAICGASPSYFQNSSVNAEICLKLVSSSADISRTLLTMQSPVAASRIAGAYQRLGDKSRADQIVNDFNVSGQQIAPRDPFMNNNLLLMGVEKIVSPYAGRILALWNQMRPIVIARLPRPPRTKDSQQSLKIIELLYSQDAYHSLSIEGYQVTEDFIKRVKDGKWNPDSQISDNEQRSALAAKGYFEAFKSVTSSVKSVFAGKNPGQIFADDLQTWYRNLFAASVQAQLIRASELAGYRNGPVFISKSRHIPPPSSAVLDSMETLEKLLIEEDNAAVRAILGHFIFVYIHPYMDGNGRVGRFLMNLMLVSGGYNWTVIRTSERNKYMSSLEEASTESKIEKFTDFVASEMDFWKKQKLW